MIHSIHISNEYHRDLLADQRKCSITKKVIEISDEIVVCANCKNIYLKEVWVGILENKCSKCGELATLQNLNNYKEIYKDIKDFFKLETSYLSDSFALLPDICIGESTTYIINVTYPYDDWKICKSPDWLNVVRHSNNIKLIFNATEIGEKQNYIEFMFGSITQTLFVRVTVKAHTEQKKVTEPDIDKGSEGQKRNSFNKLKLILIALIALLFISIIAFFSQRFFFQNNKGVSIKGLYQGELILDNSNQYIRLQIFNLDTVNSNECKFLYTIQGFGKKYNTLKGIYHFSDSTFVFDKIGKARYYFNKNYFIKSDSFNLIKIE